MLVVATADRTSAEHATGRADGHKGAGKVRTAVRCELPVDMAERLEVAFPGFGFRLPPIRIKVTVGPGSAAKSRGPNHMLGSLRQDAIGEFADFLAVCRSVGWTPAVDEATGDASGLAAAPIGRCWPCWQAWLGRLSCHRMPALTGIPGEADQP